jgi:hypothetical protein
MIIRLLDLRCCPRSLRRRSSRLAALLALIFVPTTGALAQTPALPEPVITWSGEQPAYFRAIYFAEDPWGEPLRSRGGPDAERWGFYVLSGPPLWLVVEVDGAPKEARLCVVWPDPNGERAAKPCQPLPTGPARLAFPGPENWNWPPGRYVAQVKLEIGSQQPSAEVAYAIGRRAETAAPRIDGPLPPPHAARGDGDIVSFPWPPPTPTTRTDLDRALLVHDATTLGGVAKRLTTALDSLGYSDHSFYRAPGGFALATRLEQIEFDGTPKAGPLRWSAALPPREIFSLSSFLDALFSAPEGHYRVIVFIVNDQPFSTEARAVSQEEAAAWVGGGVDRLPESIATTPLKDGHVGSALIYQFRRIGQGRASVANPDGAEPAPQQLERSGILTALRQ